VQTTAGGRKRRGP